ncbi:hypothetical protein NP596_21700, partial [Methylomonas sp. WSC-6]|nr:hypothetical protein [Methylomonas sp. WSC-6]
VLAQLLTDFAAADRTGQLALLDAILKAWSDTSPMAATFTGAYDSHNLTVNMQNLAAGSAAYNALADKLTILERFNGRTFTAVPDGTAAATVNLWTTSQDLLQRSYDSLKESVYQSLAIQTRLKPLLDLVGLSVAAEGIQLDFTELNQELDARIAADEINGFADLVELAVATNATLIANGWQGWWKVFSFLDTHSMTTEMRNVLDMAGLSLNGTTQSDAIVANSTNDTISAGDSNDWVYGAGGDDRIDGGAGDDVLLGG